MKVIGGECMAFGVGKVVERDGNTCVVEFFDAPILEAHRFNIDISLLEPIALPGQTRVYYFDAEENDWRIGRLLDDHGETQLIRFPNSVTRHVNVASVHVRWALPIEDPTAFLAAKISETPRYFEARSAFVQSITQQRGAAMGISALLSSVIELEPHQIEVARRVLQDPVQRYLLADEVGLGKTIEAGVLIRQCVLDSEGGAQILVLVPAPLIPQWREELTTKFHLGSLLDRSLHIVSVDDVDQAKALLQTASMLVIDEAHLLTSASRASSGLYDEVARVASRVERLLLLSATPALHNERGFLEMLHLLDPQTYPLDGELEFRRKIENRRPLAEIVAGLRPENALFLDDTVERLRSLFPQDEVLQELVDRLAQVLTCIPDEDDPALVDAISEVHAHLSEAYRLHRRIVRHRRRSIGGLTPDRAGVARVVYASPITSKLSAAIEDWRFGENNSLIDVGSDAARLQRARTFWKILERSLQYPSSGAGAVALLAKRPDMAGDIDRLAWIGALLGDGELFADRVQALAQALGDRLHEKSKFVVFCSDVKTADQLALVLQSLLGVVVDRHKPDDDVWRQFNSDPAHPILVCDRRAEEGLNLQGGRKTVVHFDLPLNPNRIEQRLGRVDRYGAGDAVQSIIVVCRDDPFETAWADYLENALRVFDRSIASLQYAIEATMRSLGPLLLSDGAEAIADLTAQGCGPEGAVETEIRNLDQQDALDSLGAPSSEHFDRLSEVDEDWRAIEEASTPWVESVLQFRRPSEAASASGADGLFRYRYSTDHHHTLLPLATFVDDCGAALDVAVDGRRVRAVQTGPLTFRRRTALSRQGRLAGAAVARYGEPFISGMWNLSQSDDRGRSSGLWRFSPGYQAHGAADVFLRFDFLVDVDLEPAKAALAEMGRFSAAAKAALRRRGEMALGPFFSTIWLNRELEPFSDPVAKELLALPYAPEARETGGRDYNLNNARWRAATLLDVPELGVWSQFCSAARQRAEGLLRQSPTFIEQLGQADKRAGEVSRRRLGQLKARANVATGDNDEWRGEALLVARLREGLLKPRVQVDAVSAVFLTGDMAATQIMGRT